jgi:hypothetical protein
MHSSTKPATRSPRAAPRRRRHRAVLAAAAFGLTGVTAGVAAIASASPSGTADRADPADPADHGSHGRHDMRPADRVAATLASARYQDVAVAEQAGWASTIDNLGCFQDAARGGMGVHYVNPSLMDGVVDIRQPEALVYELDANGAVAGLVAHEYIVPVEAWTSSKPPRLFGIDFHRHSVLPLWVLHTWLWKTNATGVFSDWNPAVRPCPSGVPIFGVDVPK